MKILSFPVATATQAEYAALNQHTNLIRKERLPDDPSVPLNETIRNLQSVPPFVDLKTWAVWNEPQDAIVAHANSIAYRGDENQHLLQFDIQVQPAYRRRGLGKKLLALVADAATQENRRLLMTESSDRVLAGEAFLLRMGAKKGLEAHTNQLNIGDLNPTLLQSWLNDGDKNQPEFALGLWDGAYPEEPLDAIAKLNDLVNDQPLGDLEIEDMHTTPEQLRQIEQNLFARGTQRWTFYLVHRASGAFAGYTEITWNPNRPEIAQQGLTGVYPAYRNKGLGRWLKAAMLDKILRDLPQVKFVRTGNADSNAAMLKINQTLGFKPYMANALWQVELSQVQEYLKSGG